MQVSGHCNDLNNFRLEGVRTHSTNHLERHIRAVEETCVISTATFVTCHIEVSVGNVGRVRIDVDLNTTVNVPARVLLLSSGSKLLLPDRAGV